MTTPKEVKIVIQNREQMLPVYANNTSIMFNPFEFNIEFAHIDGIVATEKIHSGAEKIEARCVAKVVLSHQAMKDLHRAISGCMEQFNLQFDGEKK